MHNHQQEAPVTLTEAGAQIKQKLQEVVDEQSRGDVAATSTRLRMFTPRQGFPSEVASLIEDAYLRLGWYRGTQWVLSVLRPHLDADLAKKLDIEAEGNLSTFQTLNNEWKVMISRQGRRAMQRRPHDVGIIIRSLLLRGWELATLGAMETVKTQLGRRPPLSQATKTKDHRRVIQRLEAMMNDAVDRQSDAVVSFSSLPVGVRREAETTECRLSANIWRWRSHKETAQSIAAIDLRYRRLSP